jgi:hypothetical protein
VATRQGTLSLGADEGVGAFYLLVPTYRVRESCCCMSDGLLCCDIETNRSCNRGPTRAVVWLNLECSGAAMPQDLGIHSCLVSVEDFAWHSIALREDWDSSGTCSWFR